MNPPRLFVLRMLVIIPFAWATTVIAAESVQSGGGISVSIERKVSTDETLLICAGFEAGRLESARTNGIRIYGSVENFYSLMHQMQCPPNSPSPIYSGVNLAAVADGYPQMFRDLAKLSPEVRERLLNRPTTGRRKETILDMLDRRMNISPVRDNAFRILKNKRDRFAELGAKKLSEMTPEELADYE